VPRVAVPPVAGAACAASAASMRRVARRPSIASDGSGSTAGPRLTRQARAQIAEVLRELGSVDQALYEAIAQVPTPVLDRLMRRLSQTANRSAIWLAIAAGLAAVGGGSGRRAAVRGTTTIGLTSALVNIGIKSLYDRPRPDRAGLGVPDRRHVPMPSSRSFPSGHSASGFAFAVAAGHEQPWLALPLRSLAAAVAYSRVHTGVHYPGDAVVGAIVGTSTGQAVTWLFDRSTQRNRTSPADVTHRSRR
jgi:membrane-associated phospholipid phosphatase